MLNPIQVLKFRGFRIRLYSGNTQSLRRESFEREVFVQESHFYSQYMSAHQVVRVLSMLESCDLTTRHYISATLRFQ